jgi:hypothetical protein
LALAGLAAGYINAVAGAGSLLTLPALIFTGLDAVSANATNRVAVLFQTAAAAFAYRRGGVRDAGKRASLLAAPGVLAAAVGAWVSTVVGEHVMRLCIAGAMLVFLTLTLVPQRRAEGSSDTQAKDPPEPPRVTASMALGFAAIGLYAGFLQAGVGILILLYLGRVHGSSLVAANAVKVVFILWLTMAALGIFVWRQAGIDPVRGLALAGSTTVGGYLGARATLRRGERFVRGVLVAAVLASVVKLGWDAL